MICGQAHLHAASNARHVVHGYVPHGVTQDSPALGPSVSRLSKNLQSLVKTAWQGSPSDL